MKRCVWVCVKWVESVGMEGEWGGRNTKNQLEAI